MARILIITEHNLNLADGLAEALAIAGHQILVAANGQQGLRIMRAAAPDLVLVATTASSCEARTPLKEPKRGFSPRTVPQSEPITAAP